VIPVSSVFRTSRRRLSVCWRVVHATGSRAGATGARSDTIALAGRSGPDGTTGRRGTAADWLE
jgi:hypothetical protein